VKRAFVRSFAACCFGAVILAQEAPPITLLGEVNAATMVCPDDLTLLACVAAAKTASSDFEHVVLLRGFSPQQLIVAVDIKDMIRTGRTHNNVRVRPGDVLFLPKQPAAGAAPWTEASALAAARRAVAIALLPAMLTESLPPDARAWMCAQILEYTDDRVLRQQCALALANGGDAARLAAALTGSRAAAREAATALGTMGPRAAAALPALRALSAVDDADLHARVAAAIRQIEGKPAGK